MTSEAEFLAEAITKQKNIQMEIWKLGCRWGTREKLFLNLLKELSIVISDETPPFQVGDRILLTDGFQAIGLALVTGKMLPVTEEPDLKQAFSPYRIEYSEHVLYAPALIFELSEGEQLQYKRVKGIGEIRKKEVLEGFEELWHKYFPDSAMIERLLLRGDNISIQRARAVLPILVRQAQAAQPITYSDLAEEVGIPFALSLRHVLSAIGDAINHLRVVWNEPDIPMIQGIVISKTTGMPSEGYLTFLSAEDRQLFEGPRRPSRVIFDRIFSPIYLYSKWAQVLAFFGLSNVPLSPPEGGGGGGGTGEGPEHKAFKEWVFKHPECLKTSERLEPFETEYKFPSQDKVDVAFLSTNTFIGVEVKSHISNEDDILRGLFQCVKYQALIEAEQIFKTPRKAARVILALQGPFPEKLIPYRNLLGIEVVDNIGVG